jgi:hypothetical protein
MEWLSRSADHAPDAKSTARRLRSASEQYGPSGSVTDSRSTGIDLQRKSPPPADILEPPAAQANALLLRARESSLRAN